MIYFVSSSEYCKHRTGKGHPEQPARTATIVEALEKAQLKNAHNSLIPRAATEDEILLCHTQSYYNLVQREVQELHQNEIQFLSTGDAPISADTFEIALLSAGGVLVAVDRVMHENATAFCIVRPPGHHACSDRGMGFCLFNNVAIGARYVQKKYGIRRVLIVDWDVHHGNGTQEIFYDDPSVFYFSTHEAGNYPGTGHLQEKGAGNIMNVPISPGLHSRVNVISAFENDLKAKMKTFQPEFVFISAGFDAHEKDSLGHFNLTDEDFVHLTQIVKEIAGTYSQGRIVSVLEGGYHLGALASAAIAHATSLK